MKSPVRMPIFLVVTFTCVCSFWAYSAWAIPSPKQKAQPAGAVTVTVPGPLRSFMRMAGISQKVSPEEVLPLLARNVTTKGYEGWQDKPSRPTEFLVLLSRYVQQARELAVLAGREHVIRVSNCNGAKPLLDILGYRFRGNCGQNTALETADPERAFLTIDSGFPLVDLEEDLQKGRPFNYPFPESQVPILFHEKDWTSIRGSKAKTLIDALVSDPALSRLYLALSRMDAETTLALRQSPGLSRLVPVSALLDFYGSHICVRAGRVVVPGGTSAESSWENLVGASTDSPGEFVLRLLDKDKGWLAAYFDALSRISRAQQAHLTASHRLQTFYEALRGRDPSPDAYRPVFRPNPGLLLLVTRLRWESNGEAKVPGGLEVWQEILSQKSDSKIVRDWAKRAGHLKNSDQLVRAMFGLTRADADAGPLQMYLFINELDAARSPEHRLTTQTIRLLASKFAKFSGQYLIFTEFPDLNEASITRFVTVAEAVDRIPDHTLRGNAMGIFQSSVGLWQILARQGQISRTPLNNSWQRVISPFAQISSGARLFDAGRDSLRELLKATTDKPNGSQDELIELLAGLRQTSREGQQVHRELAERIRAVLDGQRLVSLETIVALGDELDTIAKGQRSGSLIPLAGELREFQMPQPIFRASERTEWAAGIYNNRHTDLEMRTDLARLIKSHPSRERVAEARAQLAPFLRDTLVGLNYAYYEPPGAQILHNNPLFVRSHDFAGDTVSGIKFLWQTPQLFGVGSPAGGGAHLVGSLADLPYVLAEAEEDFIAPEHVQALIWKEVVPVLLTSAILPRWWNVSRKELHVIALYQRAGEELLAASEEDEQLRDRVTNILSDRMPPARLTGLKTALRSRSLDEVLPTIMPADTFYLAAEFRREFPGDNNSWGAAGKELVTLSNQYPTEVSWKRLSQDFGVPHPVLAQSYARELLNVQPLPAGMGYASRLLAESWDSSNLYWARLADEMGYSPVILNRLVPELTRRMVEKIFATDFEDWPAMLRALRETGEEFRQGKIALLPTTTAISRP